MKKKVVSKKIFALLLAVTMVVSGLWLPKGSAAAAEEEGAYEARIGDTRYVTFNDARKAANASDEDVTIELLSDVTVPAWSDFNNAKGKAITIDGKGHMVATVSGSGNLFRVMGPSTCTLELKNMTIDHRLSGGIVQVNNGNAASATLNLTDVVIDATKGEKYEWALFPIVSAGGTVTLNFTRVDATMAVGSKGNDGYPAIIRTGNDGQVKTMDIHLIDCKLDTVGATGRSGIVVMKGTTAAIDLEGTSILTGDTDPIVDNTNSAKITQTDDCILRKGQAQADIVSYEELKAGDKLYFGAVTKTMALASEIYGESENRIGTIARADLRLVESFDGKFGIYCYTVPEENAPSSVQVIYSKNHQNYYTAVKKTAEDTTADQAIVSSFLEHYGVPQPDASVVEALSGKSALFVGDSITYGLADRGNIYGSGGWAGRIGYYCRMNVINNGVSGACISTYRRDTRNNEQLYIYNNLVKAEDMEFDYVIMHGMFNDANDKVPLGTRQGCKGFAPEQADASTFAGGLELLFYTAKRQHPESILGFIVNFKTGIPVDDRDYADLAVSICQDWDIPYLDLYNQADLKIEFEDNLHPNSAGYDGLYTAVADWMAGLKSGEPQPIYEARIGDVKYESFNEARNAANASATDVTIELLSDVTVPVWSNFNNAKGKAITIDGNGHTVTTAAGSGNLFRVTGPQTCAFELKHMTIVYQLSGAVVQTAENAKNATVNLTDVVIDATKGEKYDYALINLLPAGGTSTLNLKRVDVTMAVGSQGLGTGDWAIIRTGNHGDTKTVNINLTDCNLDTTGATGRNGIVVMNGTTTAIELENTSIKTMDTYAIRVCDNAIAERLAPTNCKFGSLMEEYIYNPIYIKDKCTCKVQKYEDITSYRIETGFRAPTDIPTGYVFAGWYTDEACTKEHALKETDTATTSAYAKLVPSHVLSVKAQISSNLIRGNDTDKSIGSIRFVTTVDSLNYREIGFKYTITQSGKTIKEGIMKSAKVYRELYAVGATDGTLMKVNPKELFCAQSEYFKTLTIQNIPSAAFDAEITVQSFWVTLDGTTVYGEKATKTVNQGIEIIKQ